MAWIFFGAHFALFGYGIYLRGVPRLFHAYYEPALLLILLSFDIVWFALSDLMFPYTSEGTSQALIFIWLVAGIQWFAIGYWVDRWLVSRTRRDDADI